jgi:hypothetical protein
MEFYESGGGGVIKRVNSSGPGAPGAGIEKVLREYRFLQKQTKCSVISSEKMMCLIISSKTNDHLFLNK